MPKSVKLTQIFRLFLPLLIFSTLLLNLATGKDNFEKAKTNILDNPQSKKAHQSLGEILLKQNQLSQASIEFQLADNTLELKTLEDIISEPQKILSQISHWEKIIAKFPNYRDAHIKLAILNLKIGRNSEAKSNIEKALEIDSNNEVARKLLSLL